MGLTYQSRPWYVKPIIAEIRNFGIKSIGQLRDIITEEIIHDRVINVNNTEIGFLRDVLMYLDLPKYVNDCWNNHWSSIDIDTLKWLTIKFPESENMLRRYGVDIDDEEGNY